MTLEEKATESYWQTDYFKPLGLTMWIRAYLAGAEPLQKEIDDLKIKIAELENRSTNFSIH